MGDEKKCDCEIKVTTIDNGYQITVTGDNVKEMCTPENIKKCIESCCNGASNSCCSG